MNKKNLSENDICDKYTRPAMETASWSDMDQIYREFPLRTGRVVVRGQKSYFDKLNIFQTVVKAKDNNHALLAGALIDEVA